MSTNTTGARRRVAGVMVAAGLSLGLGPTIGCGSEGTGDGGTTQTDSTGASGAVSSGAMPDSSSNSGSGSVATGWERSLDVDEQVGAFFSVWGPQPELVYAAAGQRLDGGLSEGSLWQWDGAAWAEQSLPEGTAALNWVFGVDERRFLVGDFGGILVRDGDQGEWTSYACETILPMWGVWAAAPDDAWVVGGDGFNRDPFACHFDGQAWSQVSLPEPEFDSHALFKVWGTATDDVWAVGDNGLLMHWTGEANGWSLVPSGTDFDLISLWGRGPDDIVAVGGRASAVVLRWDGAQWATQPALDVPGLNGVWMAEDGTATVVGPLGTVGVVEPGSLTIESQDSGTPLALHGVFGFDDVQRWAVGGSLDMPPPFIGLVIERQP